MSKVYRTHLILGPAEYNRKPQTFGNIKQIQVFCFQNVV